MMEDLVARLVNSKVLKDPNIINAFLKADRAVYVPATLEDLAYEDTPLPLGEGQTISQPYTVAFMLELLKPQAGQKILDIGTGSGWQAALLAEIVGKEGEVLSVEIIPSLFKFAKQKLQQQGYKNIKFFQGNARTLFFEKESFDGIISAAASKEVPILWKQWLRPGGRLVCPLGGIAQSITLLQKLGAENFRTDQHEGFVFVPLVE